MLRPPRLAPKLPGSLPSSQARSQARSQAPRLAPRLPGSLPSSQARSQAPRLFFFCPRNCSVSAGQRRPTTAHTQTIAILSNYCVPRRKLLRADTNYCNTSQTIAQLLLVKKTHNALRGELLHQRANYCSAKIVPHFLRPSIPGVRGDLGCATAQLLHSAFFSSTPKRRSRRRGLGHPRGHTRTAPLCSVPAVRPPPVQGPRALSRASVSPLYIGASATRCPQEILSHRAPAKGTCVALP